MASSSQEPRKGKRKSVAASESGAHGIKVVVSEASSSAGPVFVNFPSVRPANSTPWSLYSRNSNTSTELSSQRSMLVGETNDVEYFSTNRDRPGDEMDNGHYEGSEVKYLPALYDSSTNTVHIQSTAPLYIIAHRAKRLQMLNKSLAAAEGEYRKRRNDLGETFGTKKAQKRIKARERDAVDVGAMEGVKGHLMDTIGVTEKASDVIPPSDLIPVPNLTTSEVQEIYPRSSLIPDDEWSAIDIKPLLNAKDHRAVVSILPSRSSEYVKNKVFSIMDGPASIRKHNLKYLYYLALLHAFSARAQTLSKTPITEIPAAFPGIPTQLVNGLLSRFAEKIGPNYSVTDKTRTKLRAWMCTLHLLLEGWSVEVANVTADLRENQTKIIDMYKQLGCTVELANPAERAARGITLADAKHSRKAILKAPVKFPKPKSRGPPQR